MQDISGSNTVRDSMLGLEALSESSKLNMELRPVRRVVTGIMCGESEPSFGVFLCFEMKLTLCGRAIKNVLFGESFRLRLDELS
jgi:hypothetical protein